MLGQQMRAVVPARRAAGVAGVGEIEVNGLGADPRPTFEQAFVAAHGQKLHEWYGKQLARDIEGLVRDPEALRRRMAESRYRDFAQRWSDAMGAPSERTSTRVTVPRSSH